MPSDHDQSTGRRGSGVAIQYAIDGKFIEDKVRNLDLSSCPGKTKLVPRLTLFIQVEDGNTVDAVLSPETKEYLEYLAAKQPSSGIETKTQYQAGAKPAQDGVDPEKA